MRLRCTYVFMNMKKKIGSFLRAGDADSSSSPSEAYDAVCAWPSCFLWPWFRSTLARLRYPHLPLFLLLSFLLARTPYLCLAQTPIITRQVSWIHPLSRITQPCRCMQVPCISTDTKGDMTNRRDVRNMRTRLRCISHLRAIQDTD